MRVDVCVPHILCMHDRGRRAGVHPSSPCTNTCIHTQTHTTHTRATATAAAAAGGAKHGEGGLHLGRQAPAHSRHGLLLVFVWFLMVVGHIVWGRGSGRPSVRHAGWLVGSLVGWPQHQPKTPTPINIPRLVIKSPQNQKRTHLQQVFNEGSEGVREEEPPQVQTTAPRRRARCRRRR